jgi:hypothetical protein
MKKITLIVATSLLFNCVNAQIKTEAPPPPPDAIAPPLEMPPPPPPPPPIYKNKQGYNLEVTTLNGKGTIIVRKKDFEKEISTDEWNKNKKMYEKKYGKIPEPPLTPDF